MHIAPPLPPGSGALPITRPWSGACPDRQPYGENLRLLLTAPEEELAALAPRERDIALAYRRGLSTDQVAAETGLLPSTVGRKLSAAARRLRCPPSRSVRELRRLAFEAVPTSPRVDTDNAARLRGLSPEAIAILPPAQGAVAVLAGRGLTTDQIAAELGIALPTLRVRISLAIARLIEHGRIIQDARLRHAGLKSRDLLYVLRSLDAAQAAVPGASDRPRHGRRLGGGGHDGHGLLPQSHPHASLRHPQAARP